jgi:RNA polymerase sigma-70 factor (ECF subfamily)
MLIAGSLSQNAWLASLYQGQSTSGAVERVESDTAIIERCVSGQTNDFRVLVDRHAEAVRASVRPRVQSIGEAEDVAVETFSRAFMLLKQLRDRAAFRAWLVGIAHRIVMERHRRPAATALPVAYATATALASDADPDLHRALEGLPEPLRQIVVLRFFHGLACPEIAQHLNQPVGTITKQLSRAYALLRHALAKDERHSVRRRSDHDMRQMPRSDCPAP